VVQAVLFVWVVAQSGRSLAGQSPSRFGQTIALDLTNVLERDGNADLAQYLRDQYAQYNHPFFVMMTDGRFFTSGSQSFPEPLIRMARAQLQRRLDRLDSARPDQQADKDAQGPQRDRGDAFGRRRFERPDGPRSDGPRLDGPRLDGQRLDGPRPDGPLDRLQRAGDLFERDASGFRFVRPAPIVVGGHLQGLVVVPPQAPFGFLLSRFAPMLTLVAAVVLTMGTVLTSVMIFGPARSRLRAVESAARRLGAGDLSARAPDKGGDEIAAVATAFNAMAQDLATRAEALAASDRVRRQLLADVSHELTTPITAMRGYLETLSMPELSVSDATRARYLGIISEETARLEQLIGDLLDLARLEGGGGTLRFEPVAVSQLFSRVEARHGHASEEAGVQFRSTIEPGAGTVMGDRDRLEQAIQNLAANALRYSPRGSVIKIGAKRTSDGVMLSVEDAGSAGIPAEHLPHIFDRFYKVDASRTGVSTGSGLGLSIVKAIVERHGGRMAVSSSPGCTVFEIVGLTAG